jgi:thymidylate synthase
VSITATDISDAWFQLINLIFEHGKRFKIDSGSYAGQERLEFDYITVHITNPGIRPLSPSIPPGLDIPNPTSDDYIENDYFYYLVDDQKKPNESYTYGIYIKPQMNKIIERYKQIYEKTGGYRSNQEHIIIGDWNSHLDLEDPPCLRSIDTRIQDNQLHFYVYFRSWDLWGGFPSNLGGLQLLKEYMSKEIGVNDGQLIAASKGLHLYDYSWDWGKLRTYRK